jgi:hypothetical protein
MHHPGRSKFGPVPPTDRALLRAFLGSGSFVLTGPEVWCALGPGTTALHADTLGWSTNRSAVCPLRGSRRTAGSRTPTGRSMLRAWIAAHLG